MLDTAHLNHDLLYSKYCAVISEIEGVFRERLFNDIPPGDDTRTGLIANLLGTSVSESLYLLNFLHKSLVLEGDICEFGVAQGLTSALLAYEIIKTEKIIWLFDSFQGLPKPSLKDNLKDDIFNLGNIQSYEGTMSCPVSMVKNRLSEIQFPMTRVKIIPGFIEKTIKGNDLPKTVCFAYVDFDFYEPIFLALNFLHETLQVGGHIIVDDYDFFSTGSKIAVDEFIESKPGYKLSFPNSAAGKFCIIERFF